MLLTDEEDEALLAREDKTDMTEVKVRAISRALELKEADGVDAGLFACNTTLFAKLEQLASERTYFALAEAFELYALDGQLWPVETDGKMWFSLETKESLAYAVSDGLQEGGTVAEVGGMPIAYMNHLMTHKTMHPELVQLVQ